MSLSLLGDTILGLFVCDLFGQPWLCLISNTFTDSLKASIVHVHCSAMQQPANICDF